MSALSTLPTLGGHLVRSNLNKLAKVKTCSRRGMIVAEMLANLLEEPCDLLAEIFTLRLVNHRAEDIDDACDELSHLQWVALSDARKFDMPFITEVVLAEVEARARQLDPPASVPFFKNNDEESLFLRLRGRPMPS